MTKSSEYISPREAAKHRGERLDSIYRKLWAGRIPGARRSEGRWLIPSAFAPRSRSKSGCGGRS
jgi:hypothetical protein